MKIIDRIFEAFGYAKADRSFVMDTGPASGSSGYIIGRQMPANYQAYLKQYGDATWVYTCIYRIATKGAGIPLKLYRKTKSGEQLSYEEIHTHPLIDLLETVNPTIDGYDLREATIAFEELTGNAYWLLDMFVNGKPTEIWPLNPYRVRVIPDPKDYVAGYIYEYAPGKQVRFDKNAILHFKYFNPTDDYYGLSPLSAGRVAVETQRHGDLYNYNFFQNSAEPRGILSTAQPLSPEQRNRIGAAWKSMHGGVRNAHKTAIFEAGMEWKQTSITQKDMQFIDQKKMTREDILGVFGVPPALVGIFEYANYANSQEQRKIFWEDTMMPKLKKMENVINSFLIQPYDSNLVARFDMSVVEALKENEKLKSETDEVLTRSGIKTINEVRAERGMEDVAWGSTWNAPMNLLPITSPRPEPTAPGSEPEPAAEPEQEGTPGSAARKDGEPEPAATPPTTPEEPSKPIEPPVAAGEQDTPEGQEKAARTKLWQEFKAMAEDWENKYKPVLRKNFTELEREVIQNLRDTGLENFQRSVRMTQKENIKQKLDVIFWADAEARKQMVKDGKPYIAGSMSDQAKREIRRYRLPLDWSVENPEVRRALDEKIFKFGKQITLILEDTKEELRQTLKDAIAAGETISQVEGRIENVFDLARGYRTERIARTEIISATNEGSMRAYDLSGTVEKKVWISPRDSDVRPSHQIDGEAVDTEDAFSNGLQFPGDPSG